MTKDTRSRRAPKGRRAPITRERIAAAAFTLVDAEGEAALSARRLAALLQCEAMSLYHHLPNMEAVLDTLVDQLLGTLEVPPVDGDPGAALRRAGRSFLALAEQHPRVVRIVVARRWTTPIAFARVQALVALYVAAGVPAALALRHARVLGAYLGGATSALAGWQLDGLRVRSEEGSDPHPGVAAQDVQAQSTAALVRADLEAGLDWLLAAQLGQGEGALSGSRPTPRASPDSD